jgi:thioredoxin 1
LKTYSKDAPTRAEIDGLAGAVVLEFGTDWCGYCRRARPLIDPALAAHPGTRHLMVEDGKGRLLGRSFGIKLWPTLIFLRDGAETERLVRPVSEASVQDALTLISR